MRGFGGFAWCGWGLERVDLEISFKGGFKHPVRRKRVIEYAKKHFLCPTI